HDYDGDTTYKLAYSLHLLPLQTKVSRQLRILTNGFHIFKTGRCNPLRGEGRSPVPLETKQSPKKANWLPRRHSRVSEVRRIMSTDDNLCIRHAYRLDKSVESGCV